MQKLWFSLFDPTFDYKGKEPSFADEKNFDWAGEISINTDKIIEELNQYLKRNNLSGYFNSSMVTKKGTWKTIALKTWSVELYKNQKEFPYTTALINKYPQIISASFNLLEPGGRIVPHCGDTNAIYRCHLGLEIPSALPDCGFSVKDEKRSWEKGKWIIFMDAYQHEAWNTTTKERYIFLIDVMRSEFSDKQDRVTSTVLTSLFLQKRVERFKFLTALQHPILTKLVTKILRPFAALSIRYVNRFKVY